MFFILSEKLYFYFTNIHKIFSCAACGKAQNFKHVRCYECWTTDHITKANGTEWSPDVTSLSWLTLSFVPGHIRRQMSWETCERTLQPAWCRPPISNDPPCARQWSQTRKHSSDLWEADSTETSGRKHTQRKCFSMDVSAEHSLTRDTADVQLISQTGRMLIGHFCKCLRLIIIPSSLMTTTLLWLIFKICLFSRKQKVWGREKRQFREFRESGNYSEKDFSWDLLIGRIRVVLIPIPVSENTVHTAKNACVGEHANLCTNQIPCNLLADRVSKMYMQYVTLKVKEDV